MVLLCLGSSVSSRFAIAWHFSGGIAMVQVGFGRETTLQNVADLVVFCFNLIGCCLSLVMTVALPVFCSRMSMQLRVDMLCLNKDDDDDVEGGDEESRGLSNKSMFRNLWTKCKQLAL